LKALKPVEMNPKPREDYMAGGSAKVMRTKSMVGWSVCTYLMVNRWALLGWTDFFDGHLFVCVWDYDHHGGE
jgi:hypothetical protein